MQEKKKGQGEDSDPIFFSFDKQTVIGVFDGMGGAGGAECESDFGIGFTKAYVASRIIKTAIENLIRQNPSIISQENFRDILIKTIEERYQQELQKYPPKSKVLRSPLIKEYPTTLAITCIRKEESKYIIDSFWAGDSRNYIWTSEGLFQISKDDLRGNLDPLQNLRDDAPMSNCIHADGKFSINHIAIEDFSVSDKFIIISATDGCFGYYPSPMDFETTFSDCVRNSSNLSEFKKKLSQAFEDVTADDFSYSIAAFGFHDFKDIKKTLGKINNTTIRSYSIKRGRYAGFIRKREKITQQIDLLNEELEGDINKIWNDYKNTYLKFLNEDEKG